MPSILLAAFSLLISGEQFTCGRERVHDAPPGLWGLWCEYSKRPCNKILIEAGFFTIGYVILVSNSIRVANPCRIQCAYRFSAAIVGSRASVGLVAQSYSLQL